MSFVDFRKAPLPQKIIEIEDIIADFFVERRIHHRMIS
jgi:hypothetical protein